MKLCALAVVVVILLATVKCDDSVQSEAAHPEVAEAINSFSSSLYLLLSEAPGNLIVSPLSVNAVLAMILVGLRGTTAQHVSSALQLPADRQRVEKGFKALMASLQGSENVTLKMANKIYVQEDFRLKDEFRQSLANNFRSTAEQVDFFRKTESVRVAINQWSEEQTNYKIKELLAKGSLDPSTIVMLINAIYFKGLWESEFSKNFTSEEVFRLDSKSGTTVPMMHQKGYFRYGKLNDQQAQVLRLPYQGKKISMVIFLPKEVDGLRSLERNITSVNVSNILNSLQHKEVMVTLPRFKIESSIDLKKPLEKLGLGEILQPGADFSGMTGENVYINKVLQKAFIEVNEEGTEAAAVTAGGAIAVSLPPPPQVFKADHPFMFMIVDERKDTILFMGRVAQP